LLGGNSPTQEEMMQIRAHQAHGALFLAIYPSLMMNRVQYGYPVEGGLTDEATPDRVADEASEYALAGLVRLGFSAQKANGAG